MIDGLKRRLALVNAAIRPANSIAARLRQLTSEQQAIYSEWQRVHERWVERFVKPDGIWRAYLDGYVGPQLPHDIHRVLFGEQPQLTADNLRDVYDRMAHP
jgi:hypothetical protein